MMTEKVPYELLVRWDDKGVLAGAHAQFRYVTRDAEGTVLGEFLGSAEPVELTGDETALIAALPSRLDPPPAP